MLMITLLFECGMVIMMVIITKIIPIEVTLLGIVTEVSAAQLKKALSPNYKISIDDDYDSRDADDVTDRDNTCRDSN